MNEVTILLVEDSYADQRLTREALTESDRGTQLQVVKDGCEAIDYIWRRGKYAFLPHPDLIILDLNLPKKSGHEVLAEMRENPFLRNIPVVIFTSSMSPGEKAEMQKLNANFYIIKPDSLEKFFAVIKAIEDFTIKYAENPQYLQELSETLRQSAA